MIQCIQIFKTKYRFAKEKMVEGSRSPKETSLPGKLLTKYVHIVYSSNSQRETHTYPAFLANKMRMALTNRIS